MPNSRSQHHRNIDICHIESTRKQIKGPFYLSCWERELERPKEFGGREDRVHSTLQAACRTYYICWTVLGVLGICMSLVLSWSMWKQPLLRLLAPGVKRCQYKWKHALNHWTNTLRLMMVMYYYCQEKTFNKCLSWLKNFFLFASRQNHGCNIVLTLFAFCNF